MTNAISKLFRLSRSATIFAAMGSLNGVLGAAPGEEGGHATNSDQDLASDADKLSDVDKNLIEVENKANTLKKLQVTAHALNEYRMVLLAVFEAYKAERLMHEAVVKKEESITTLETTEKEYFEDLALARDTWHVQRCETRFSTREYYDDTCPATEEDKTCGYMLLGAAKIRKLVRKLKKFFGEDVFGEGTLSQGDVEWFSDSSNVQVPVEELISDLRKSGYPFAFDREFLESDTDTISAFRVTGLMEYYAATFEPTTMPRVLPTALEKANARVERLQAEISTLKPDINEADNGKITDLKTRLTSLLGEVAALKVFEEADFSGESTTFETANPEKKEAAKNSFRETAKNAMQAKAAKMVGRGES